MNPFTCLDCDAPAQVAGRCVPCQKLHNQQLIRAHDAVITQHFRHREPPRPPSRRALRRQALVAAQPNGDGPPPAA